MIQKLGISAYIRLKKQLVNPVAAQNTRYIPHLHYWEKLMEDVPKKLL